MALSAVKKKRVGGKKMGSVGQPETHFFFLALEKQTVPEMLFIKFA
jgi:hypothetical protein